MYLVFLFANHEKQKCSLCSNHSSRQERRRGEPASRFRFHVLLLSGALLPRTVVCSLVLPVLYHPAECRHGLVQRGAGSFPTTFADGVDNNLSWAVPEPSTLISYAPWTIVERFFMESLLVTTAIDLTTELFPHQRISLFPSAV